MPSTLHIPSTAVAVVIDLPFLASEINDAHRQVIFHGKSMLLEARRAGEHLLKAKEQVRHGEFKAWIEANCQCSYATAKRYMQVAKRLTREPFDLDTSLREFLGYEDKKAPPAEPTLPTFDRTDAEHVMKLRAMIDRGGTQNEREKSLSRSWRTSPAASG